MAAAEAQTAIFVALAIVIAGALLVGIRKHWG